MTTPHDGFDDVRGAEIVWLRGPPPRWPCPLRGVTAEKKVVDEGPTAP